MNKYLFYPAQILILSFFVLFPFFSSATTALAACPGGYCRSAPDESCSAPLVEANDNTCAAGYGACCPNANDPTGSISDDVQHGLSKNTLERLNPLKSSPVGTELSTPGGIISRIMAFAFPLAGLILFLMLVVSGFEMLATSATKKSIDSGKKRATDALLGFLLLFSVYWIAQIIGYVFQIDIV